MRKLNIKKFESNFQVFLILLFVFLNLAYVFNWFGLRTFDKERTGDDCSENTIVCFGKEKREI